MCCVHVCTAVRRLALCIVETVITSNFVAENVLINLTFIWFVFDNYLREKRSRGFKNGELELSRFSICLPWNFLDITWREFSKIS